MTSKEAFERLLKDIVVNETMLMAKYGYSASNNIELIKQDLDRLENFEVVIYILNEICNIEIGDFNDNVGVYKIAVMGKHFFVNKEIYYAFKKVLNKK